MHCQVGPCDVSNVQKAQNTEAQEDNTACGGKCTGLQTVREPLVKRVDTQELNEVLKPTQ